MKYHILNKNLDGMICDFKRNIELWSSLHRELKEKYNKSIYNNITFSGLKWILKTSDRIIQTDNCNNVKNFKSIKSWNGVFRIEDFSISLIYPQINYHGDRMNLKYPDKCIDRPKGKEISGIYYFKDDDAFSNLEPL